MTDELTSALDVIVAARAADDVDASLEGYARLRLALAALHAEYAIGAKR